MWGFVLLNVSPGKESEFFSDLGSVEHVRHVFYLLGDYEYLLELEADTPQDMARIMTDNIRRLPGVERTAPYIEGTQGAACPVHHPPEPEDSSTLW